MKVRRIASACVVLLASPGGIGCEPAEPYAPPALPQSPAPLPGPAGETPPATAEAAGNGEGMYSSGDVAVGAETDAYDDDDPSALGDFRSTLDPHGTWVDDSTYGTVWVPAPTDVGADFRPYVTAGHWAYDDDWVWVSDYEWGWAPFHYGRWVWIGGRGWAWIPGRVYRGAWVTWGIDDGYGYVGWAPMPPAFVWFGGAAVVFPVYVPPRWVYCPRGEVFSPVVRTRIVGGAAEGTIASRMHPYVAAAPTVASAGPPPQKLGFQAAQIPRPTGATARGVTRAQQFSTPSTAQALGARAPTREPLVGQASRGAAYAPGAAHAPGASHIAPGPGPSRVPATLAPGRVPAPGAARPQSSPAPSSPVRAGPTPHMQTSPGFHGARH